MSRGWRLTGAAWRLMSQDPTMVVLALIGTGCGLVGTALMLYLGGVFSPAHYSRSHFGAISLLFLYPLSFIGVFFNVALTAAASATLEGRWIGVRGAVEAAWSRIGRIAQWSLLAVVIGFVINQIASPIPAAGRVIAWTLVAFFPVLVVGLVGVSVARHDAVIGIGLIVVAAVAFVGVIAISNATRQVFNLALFRYATAGAGTPGFDVADFEAAFARKQARRRTRNWAWIALGIIVGLILIGAIVGHHRRTVNSAPSYTYPQQTAPPSYPQQVVPPAESSFR